MTLLKLFNVKMLLSVVIFSLSGLVASFAAPVTQVTVIKTNDMPAYVEKLKEGQAILERMNSSGKMRVWVATIAGANSGNIGVAVEWESLSAFAVDGEKIQSNQEWRNWLASLGEIRKILSVNLYTEIDLN